MKKLLVFIFLAFAVNTVEGSPVKKSDEETLIKLVDSLSAALVKQNKVWLTANLTQDCSLTDPMGKVLTKDDLIKAFSAEGIYSLSKMKTTGMKYTIANDGASATGAMEIEGAMSAQEVIDISDTYHIETAFKKTETGWKISSIVVSQKAQ